MDFGDTFGYSSLQIGLVAISLACLFFFARDLKACEGPKEKRFVIISAFIYVIVGGVLIFIGANMVVFLLLIYSLNKVLERRRLDIRRFGET
jgi:heme A synthase